MAWIGISFVRQDEEYCSIMHVKLIILLRKLGILVKYQWWRRISDEYEVHTLASQHCRTVETVGLSYCRNCQTTYTPTTPSDMYFNKSDNFPCHKPMASLTSLTLKGNSQIKTPCHQMQQKLSDHPINGLASHLALGANQQQVFYRDAAYRSLS